ncbi:MAG: PAS domain S-box protein [Pleurocapsa sp.]
MAVFSFMPHGMCYLWKPWLVGVHLVSNGVIALAYFSIPITLIYILRRRGDIPFNGIFWLFAAFILFCGAGHTIDIWTLWHPNYWLSSWIKLWTALVSLATAIALINKIPEILTLPSPTQVNNINQQLQAKIAELERQKAIIRQQEEFLRTIYDHVQEAIFVIEVELDGTFRYQGFNPAAIRLTGISDVVGKTPAQIMSFEATAAVERRYKECLQTATAITYEECLSFQDRDTWWLTNLNPIKDEAGNISRLVGTSLNISDRKQAEIELDRDKQFLQALLDNLSDGIVSCDQNGIITLFNRATRKFHGLPESAIPASQWAEHYDLYLPDGQTRMSAENIPLFRALTGELVRDVEMKIIPKQGKPRILLANGNPIIDGQGEKIGAIVAMRDITERKEAEAELERERIFIKTLLNNLSDGIVACDQNGNLILFNQAIVKFHGLPQPGIPADQWAEHYNLYDAEGKHLLQQEDIPLWRALSGESFINAELMVIPHQGKARTLITNGSPIIDGKGVKLGAVVAIQDVTERKKAEQEVAKLNRELEARVKQRTAQLEQLNMMLLTTARQLEQRNQELDQFAYVTSHDLKAPLRAIANLSEWIEEDLADKMDKDTKYNMNLLRGRVHRLENLINALLTYSRVGRLESNVEEVSVRKMLADIIDLLDIPEHFQIEIKGEMPTFITDAVPLQQVFNNLISNAIKHSNSLAGKITISVIERANHYEFSVADNGKGIDPKYHNRIFTIFQTLESRDTKENTGIGLAIVKKAVTNQGGQIAIESKLGEGATFRFTWPKKSQKTK